MQRQWIESSVLASVGYDRGGRVLEVEFKHGGVYRYRGVPEQSIEELMTAGSHGSYFGRQIRNRYQSQKVN
jgi:hypothetical protein